MKLLIAGAPLLVTMIALVLGLDVVVSAAVGVVVAIGLYGSIFLAFDGAALLSAIAQTSILLASVVCVLVPGQTLNLILERSGRLARITRFMEAITIDAPTKALIVVLGLAPAIESLTGFGVSLFVTVPILLHLFPPRTAARLSLIGMNIMPWGTLALATLVGAQLAGQDAQLLGLNTAMFSLGVFPILGIAAAFALREVAPGLRLWQRGLIIGLLMGASLVVANLLLPVDIAGIAAGLVTTGFGYVLYASPSHLASRRLDIGSLLPYAILLGLILIAKVVVDQWQQDLAPLALTSGAMSFAWFASPGIPLLLTAAWLALGSGAPTQRLTFGQIVAKVWRPIAGIGSFILLSQIMKVSGAIDAIWDVIGGVSEMYLIAIVPTLGAVSGYITGSNLGGNVLMMPIQQSLAANTDLATLAPAVQNAASGHTLFASLPMILLVLAIADQRDESLQSQLVAFSLKLMGAILAAIILQLAVMTYFG